MSGNNSDSQEHRRVLSKILASDAFHRSTRSKQLLEYLIGHHFGTNPDPLHEAEIGRRLFERGENFDPAIDSIVRASMRQLRNRLADYYANEGTAEKWELQIPKGDYRLLFLTRAVPGEAIECEPGVGAEMPSPGGKAPAGTGGVPVGLLGEQRDSRQRVISYVIAVALLAGAFWAGHALRPLSPQGATVGPIAEPASLGSVFAHFLGKTDGRVDFVPSDSVMNLIQSFTGNTIGFEEYQSRQAFAPNHPSSRPNPRHWQGMVTRELLNIGDASLVLRAAQQHPSHLNRFGFRQSRDLRARDLRTGNFVFLGAVNANPWVKLVSGPLNYKYGRRDGDATPRWRTESPRPGEPPMFPPADREGGRYANESYAQIALVPNLSGDGKVLLVGGISQPDTEAAGEFVLAAGSADTLASAMGLRSLDEAPIFEVMLRTEREGNAWKVSEVVAHQIQRTIISHSGTPGGARR